jgi:hypothetical protein
MASSVKRHLARPQLPTPPHNHSNRSPIVQDYFCEPSQPTASHPNSPQSGIGKQDIDSLVACDHRQARLCPSRPPARILQVAVHEPINNASPVKTKSSRVNRSERTYYLEFYGLCSVSIRIVYSAIRLVFTVILIKGRESLSAPDSISTSGSLYICRRCSTMAAAT